MAPAHELLSSAQLARTIARTDFSSKSVLVVGYGFMGAEYVKALEALGVGEIIVCSRSKERLEPLISHQKIRTISGGYDALASDAGEAPDLAIIATPTQDLAAAAERAVEWGSKKLLIEKPVALESQKIEELNRRLARAGIEAYAAYNRAAYPAFVEARSRMASEGGVTSCAYTFTELIRKIKFEAVPQEEQKLWGIANSLHVMSLAHCLIGLPRQWSSYKKGALDWHPSGSIFVGSGISQKGVPFSFHADWGSTGRWSVEAHTAASSYRLCPLEELFRKISWNGDWEKVALTTFAPEIKTGIAEETAAMLDESIARQIPLPSLQETILLTRFGEDIFGYSA